MLLRLLRAALPAVLLCILAPPLARADIYTWVDASGTLNVSNLSPPDGVRVTNVIHASVQKTPQRDDATREAEVLALAERVRLLEDELVMARRPPAPAVEYRPLPAPIPYPVDAVAPPMQYSFGPSPPMSTACDASWMNCGLWAAPAIYPASVVVLLPTNVRPFHPVHPGGHPPSRPPMRASNGFRMR